MGRIKLSTYLNKIEAKYIKAREDWEKTQNELIQEEERFNNIKWSNYSPQGRQEESTKHQEKKKALREKFEEIRKTFSEDVEKIKESSDKVFSKLYKHTPGEVDMNGVALLNNSSLSPVELLELAESYRNSGNYTMYFMVADRMKSDKSLDSMDEAEKTARAYYEEARRQRKKRTDHELLEGFRDICLKALREERGVSDGIHRHHEEFYQEYKNSSDRVEVVSDSPWD